jgi:hypothetical protein
MPLAFWFWQKYMPRASRVHCGDSLRPATDLQLVHTCRSAFCGYAFGVLVLAKIHAASQSRCIAGTASVPQQISGQCMLVDPLATNMPLAFYFWQNCRPRASWVHRGDSLRPTTGHHTVHTSRSAFSGFCLWRFAFGKTTCREPAGGIAGTATAPQQITGQRILVDLLSADMPLAFGFWQKYLS